MKDVNYIEIARNDSTWREVVATMQISGFDMDALTEILIGKMIAGELTLTKLIEVVTSSATDGSQSPIDTPPQAA